MPEILDLRKKNQDVPLPSVNGNRGTGWGEISGQIKPGNQPIDKPLIIGTSIVLLLIAAGFIFWSASYITAIFFTLLGVVMILTGFKEKKTINWKLHPFGLTVDAFSYPYADLKSFWIEYHPPHLKELSFKSKKWYHSYIKIPLNKESPLEIREFLLQYLLEEKHEDTLVEIISRKFGI